MSEKTIHDILAQFREEALNNRHLGDCFERYQITIDKASAIKNSPQRLEQRIQQPSLHRRSHQTRDICVLRDYEDRVQALCAK